VHKYEVSIFNQYVDIKVETAMLTDGRATRRWWWWNIKGPKISTLVMHSWFTHVTRLPPVRKDDSLWSYDNMRYSMHYWQSAD